MGAWSFVHARLHACLPERLRAPPREPSRIRQPRHRQRRPAPAGAGRSVATCHWLRHTTSWWTGRTWPPKDERFPASSNWTRPCAPTPPRTPAPASSWWSTPPSSTASTDDRARRGAPGHAQRRDHLAAGRRHRSRRRLRVAHRRADRRDRPVQRLVPGVPRGAPLALRRRPADRRQAGARRGLDLHAAPAHPGPEEPCRHRGGQGQEGSLLGARQGSRAGQGGQEGGQALVQGPEERRPACGGTTGRHLVAHHADRASAGPGQGQPGLLERHRRGSRRGAASAGTGEGQEWCQEERTGQEAGCGEAGQEPRRTPRSTGWPERHRPTGRRPDRDGGPPPERKRPTPPPAVNEPLAFINFVAAFPVGSTSKGRSSPSPRTVPWWTCPCPTAGRCTATSR